MKKLLVLARTAAEAGQFCRDHNIPVTAVAYVADETRVRGYQNPAYVVLEGFWDRIDAMGIWMTLQQCMTTPLDVPNRLQPAARIAMPPVPVVGNTIITTTTTTGTWTQPAPTIEADEDELPLPAPLEPPAGHMKQFKKIRVPE